MRFLTLKVFSFGSSSKPLIDKLIIMDEATGVRYLRDLIKDAVKEKDDKIDFNAKDDEIQKIVGNGGTDISALLNHPSNLVPAQFNALHVTIIPSVYVADDNVEDPEIVDLMEENKVEMTFLESEFSLEEVESFQEAYRNMTVGRQRFLDSCSIRPSYDLQIKAAVLHTMENAPNGMRPVGFRERKGDRARRLKEKEEAEAAALSLASNDEPAIARKIDQSNEKEALESAIRSMVEVLAFVNDHRCTLSSRFANLFKTPMLQAIEGANPEGVALRSKRSVKQMSVSEIAKQLKKISKASRDLPSWHHSSVTSTSPMRKGEVVVHELENMQSILAKYRNHLNSQGALNFLAKSKPKGNKPSNANSEFFFVNRVPSRERRDKRSENQLDVYRRADKIMKKMQGMACYETLQITDKAMGLDGSEWEGGRDGYARPNMRKKIIAQLGSNVFKTVMCKYKPGGQATNHVVIAKVPGGVSLSNELVQNCRRTAETSAPQCWSRRETCDAIEELRLLTGINKRTAYSKLNAILPSSVTLHNKFNRLQSNLLRLTTTLMNMADDVSADTAMIASDLRRLNLGRNGELDTSKFEVFFKAMEYVVEMGGTGAHKKRHTQGEDVEKTKNVVYSSQFNSIEHVIKATTEYMTKEKRLTVGTDFFVPSKETVRMSFSPARETRALSGTFLPRLSIKLVIRKKNARKKHAHAPYCAKQKTIVRHHVVEGRNHIESDRQDSEPVFDRPWDYYIDFQGKDDKANVDVSEDYTCPVAATAYQRARAVVPGNTEIHSADHDYNGTAKIAISVTCDFNIGTDPSESLLSGGEEGNGAIHVEVHDAVFHKSTNYHHMMSAVRIVRQKRIRMLVRDDELPSEVVNTEYHHLSESQRTLVDGAMPVLCGQEVDGGQDHKNTHFQNMLAYIGGALLLRCDRFFIFRGCPGNSYLNTTERAMPLLNLSLANHSAFIDPETPDWLRLILHQCSSLNQVRLAIAEHDEELKKAIKFRSNAMGVEFEDEDVDAEDDESRSSPDQPFFPEVPVINASIKKFVSADGWYDGSVMSVIGSTVNVKLENGSEEQWSLDTYTAYRNDALIEVGDVGYKYMEVFVQDGGHVPYNVEVIAIRTLDQKRKVKYDDGSTKHFPLSHIETLSTMQWSQLEDEKSEGESESESEVEEVPYSKPPPPKKKSTSGKYFKGLNRLTLNELKAHSTARSEFAKAMKYPIEELERRFAKVTLDKKPVEIHPWPGDDAIKELTDLLKAIDPGFSTDIRSWGQFKSKMPILHAWFEKHVRHHDYLTEISICNESDCTVCRMVDTGLRTPDNDLARHILLRPIARPVKDPGNINHFVPAGKTARFIADRGLSFEQLKKELPKVDGDPAQSKEDKDDKEADTEAGGSKLFKGQKVRDIVPCKECDFPRCLYSMHKLNSSNLGLSKSQQKKRLNELDQFKDTYVCGDNCPVEGFETRRALRCGDFVETQFFTYAKGANDWNVGICCYCCSPDDLLTVDKMKEKFDCGGQQPLRLCKSCAELGIKPPMTNAATSFVEKTTQRKATKKRQARVFQAMGAKKRKN